ncbi:ABC transporter permease [Mycobacterium sp. 21AC1]|uniref:ABC transporter permease n=1 Tax=[Mycobacterium] appelbergii TaxID=2939269 RepID=UPI00293930F3|nr:ABC transporter permease [Mycobacterium sp. 21AC1]MDV3125045.1 ABC transporter permease [Mycobacterium sp. 21AC1]
MALVRRAGQYALVLWAAVTLNFALPHLAPGDPVVYLYGGAEQTLAPELLAEIRKGYGLDRPILEQYVSFWSGLLHGDLGMSVQHNRPVVDVLADKLPWTLALVGIATLLAFVLGTLLGAWAAWRRGTAKETGTVVTVLALDAMPGFWIGMILIAVFSVSLGWFPSYGAATITATGGDWLVEVGSRMVLPIATLTIAGIGAFFLMTRASMISVLDEPFVRLARAKGLNEYRIAIGHALRNALLPVYTTLTLALGVMLSGTVVVETVFAYPGLGKLIYDAVTARDYPLLQGAFLFATVGIVAANVVADLTYPLLDPRVRRDRTEAKKPAAVNP